MKALLPESHSPRGRGDHQQHHHERHHHHASPRHSAAAGHPSSSSATGAPRQQTTPDDADHDVIYDLEDPVAEAEAVLARLDEVQQGLAAQERREEWERGAEELIRSELLDVGALRPPSPLPPPPPMTTTTRTAAVEEEGRAAAAAAAAAAGAAAEAGEEGMDQAAAAAEAEAAREEEAAAAAAAEAVRREPLLGTTAALPSGAEQHYVSRGAGWLLWLALGIVTQAGQGLYPVCARAIQVWHGTPTLQLAFLLTAAAAAAMSAYHAGATLLRALFARLRKRGRMGDGGTTAAGAKGALQQPLLAETAAPGGATAVAHEPAGVTAAAAAEGGSSTPTTPTSPSSILWPLSRSLLLASSGGVTSPALGGGRWYYGGRGRRRGRMHGRRRRVVLLQSLVPPDVWEFFRGKVPMRRRVLAATAAALCLSLTGMLQLVAVKFTAAHFSQLVFLSTPLLVAALSRFAYHDAVHPMFWQTVAMTITGGAMVALGGAHSSSSSGYNVGNNNNFTMNIAAAAAAAAAAHAAANGTIASSSSSGGGGGGSGAFMALFRGVWGVEGGVGPSDAVGMAVALAGACCLAGYITIVQHSAGIASPTSIIAAGFAFQVPLTFALAQWVEAPPHAPPMWSGVFRGWGWQAWGAFLFASVGVFFYANLLLQSVIRSIGGPLLATFMPVRLIAAEAGSWALLHEAADSAAQVIGTALASAAIGRFLWAQARGAALRHETQPAVLAGGGGNAADGYYAAAAAEGDGEDGAGAASGTSAGGDATAAPAVVGGGEEERGSAPQAVSVAEQAQPAVLSTTPRPAAVWPELPLSFVAARIEAAVASAPSTPRAAARE